MCVVTRMCTETAGGMMARFNIGYGFGAGEGVGLVEEVEGGEALVNPGKSKVLGEMVV